MSDVCGEIIMSANGLLLVILPTNHLLTLNYLSEFVLIDTCQHSGHGSFLWINVLMTLSSNWLYIGLHQDTVCSTLLLLACK